MPFYSFIHLLSIVLIRLLGEDDLALVDLNKTIEVSAGESVRYDRVFPHRYRALEDARLMVITERQ